MSVRLTTHLSQRLVLTPQLRQRIEMLQMTSVELSDLIQQQLLENPILEEVIAQEETRDLAEEILDHQTSGVNDGEKQKEAVEASDAKDETTDFTNATPEYEPVSDASLTAPSEAESYEEAGASSDDAEERSVDDRDAFEEIDFGREFQEYLDPGYKTQEFEYKEDAPSFEQFLTRPPSLAEHLSWQLNMDPIEPELVEIADSIIGNIDASGRLHATNEEIADLAGCDTETVERARQVVLHLDPVGCAARDLSECLLVQLTAKGHGEGLAAQLIRDHPLTELQPHKLNNLSKLIGVAVEDLMLQLELIRTLDPHPGRRYSSDDTILISPEIFIEKVDDDYEIYFFDDGSPRLRISQSYKYMLGRNDTSKETRDFIKDKMRSAVDLLRNIEHRRQTIYRVVECIVQRQREFLDKGVQFIRPMMLKDIAEETGMHLSTISRVVNRKYAHTPQGVIELRRFFTEGMTNEDGEEVSTRIIKLQIKKLIEEEDSHNPITDDHVVKILAKDGIRLSRRTVAKYRDQMQIPGSRERRAPM
ncbi:MAG: RNA polymerase factor sigma-54 [Pyrinomonadaceae bacterium MAG19_C2-C3]|nr:RNA polymerase factor sigma-54 [Pyrinomonadaceae bacterium MAG19_C2-C3]